MTYLKIYSILFQKTKTKMKKKEEGNLAADNGKLGDAYTLYSDALQIDPYSKYINAALFFNRALVSSKVRH